MGDADEGCQVGETRADDCDGGLDGGPDEDGAHEVGYVCGVHEGAEEVDADYTCDADAGRMLVSSFYFFFKTILGFCGTHKIPTAIIQQIAAFFCSVICSLIIRGNGSARIIKSFNMLMIPVARKNWLILIHLPVVVPLNWVQKKLRGLQALAMVIQTMSGYATVMQVAKMRAIFNNFSSGEKMRR